MRGDTQLTAAEKKQRTLTLLACCFSLFIVTLDGTIVNIALPSIQRDFGSTISGLQWILDAYTLVLATLMLSAGAIGDRIGRKKVFQVGLVTFGAGSLLCSLAPSVGALVVFRMIQAVGGSMLIPTTMSIITNTFTDPKERAAAIGIWGGVSGLSIASGPVLGGLLTDGIGWRAVFWVNLPVVAVALIMAARYIGESRAPSPRRVDLVGQLLAIVFLVSLTYALIEGPSYGWSDPVILALFSVAAVSLGSFLLAESWVREPLLSVRFFRNRSFSGATAIAFVAFVAFVGFIFFNTLYLQEVRGYSPLLAGVASLPATLAIVVASPLSGKVTGTRGPRGPIVVAGLLVGAGLLVLIQTTPTVSFGVLFVGYVMVGVGIGLINPPITNAAVSGMPVEQAGVASGLTGAARQVGVVFGVAFLGSAVTTRFTQILPSRLAALHLPSSLQSLVITRARSGSVPPHGHETGLVAQIGHVVAAAFTEAVHRGYLLGAVAGFLAAAIGWFTMGNTRPAEVEDVVQSAPARASVIDAPVAEPQRAG
jgi:EmrB/QacA subfamily drug resistance transporter